jgi:hypothetical protein
MIFDATIRTLLLFVAGIAFIALELLALHTLVWVKAWFERHVYTDLVRAAVDYAEEWAYQQTQADPPRKIFGEDKLAQAVYYVGLIRGLAGLPTLKLDIHAELGRRRALRLIVHRKPLPPPLPPPRAV